MCTIFFVQKFLPKIFSWQKHTFEKKIRYEPHGEQIVNGIKRGFFSYVAFSDTHMQYFHWVQQCKRERARARPPPTPARCPVYTCAHGKNSSNCSKHKGALPIGATESFLYLDSSSAITEICSEGESRGSPVRGRCQLSVLILTCTVEFWYLIKGGFLG